MIDLDDIQARLTATAAPPLKLVASVASSPAAQGQARGVPQSPAAFVLLTSEDADPSRYATGAHAQRTRSRFGVLQAVRELSDAKGGAGMTTLQTVRTAVIGALIGWQPESVDEPIDFVRGQLVDLQDGVLWWLDEFGTSFDLTS